MAKCYLFFCVFDYYQACERKTQYKNTKEYFIGMNIGIIRLVFYLPKIILRDAPKLCPF